MHGQKDENIFRRYDVAVTRVLRTALILIVDMNLVSKVYGTKSDENCADIIYKKITFAQCFYGLHEFFCVV